MVDPDDLRTLALKIRYDLTASQAKISELLELIARLPAVDRPESFDCPQCGIRFGSTQRLGEHLENIHGVLPFIGKEERL